MSAFFIFGILYQQADRTFLAEIQARSASQAVQVFWEEFAAGSLPIPDGEIQVVSVEEVSRAEEVPYPEALPAGPALLAVVELGKSEER